MISEEAVREALHTVTDPDIGKPLDELGMVKGVRVDGDAVKVELALLVPGSQLKSRLTEQVTEAVRGVSGVGHVDVSLGMMPDEERAQLTENLKQNIPFRNPDTRTSVVGISSGKGGVGKSTVTANLAASLSSLGHKVGVLDADIWGFSIPRMFGLRGQRPAAFNQMILPLDRNGVKVISIGFFLESEEDPVVWRGPMLHKALEQFLSDVYWGEDLDYLLIDLPPGTGDISLSLATFVPNMGMIVCTTPQPVAQKVAERAANMAGKVKQRLLGVIENMSGIVCEHCGERTPVFGEDGGRQLAETLEIPLLGQIPLLPALREYSDAGTPFVWERPDHEVTRIYQATAQEVAKFRPRRRLPVMQVGARGRR